MFCIHVKISAVLSNVLLAVMAISGSPARAAAPADTAQQPELVWQSGHTSPVNVVSFSPDGKLLASGSGSNFSYLEKNVVLLWDVATGTQLRVFRTNAPVTWIAFSPDGRRIAAKSDASSAEVKVWDITNGAEVTDEKVGPEYVIRPVSPDGKIAAEIDGLSIRLRDATNRPLRTLASRTSDFQKVMFSPDSSILASGGTRLSIRLWDLRSGTLRTLVGHTDYPIAADFSPDSRLFASGGKDLTVRIWDVASGREIKTLVGHTGVNVRGIKFSPDGKSLLSFDRTGFKLWDVTSGRELVSADGAFYESDSDYAVFNPQGGTLAADVDGEVILYSTETGNELRRFSGSAPIDFSPDGKRLVAGAVVQVQMWDLTSGKRLVAFGNGRWDEYPVDRFRKPVFSPDSQTLAVWEDDEREKNNHRSQVHLMEAATGKVLRNIKFDANDFDSSGTLVFTGDSREIMRVDDTVTVWNVGTAEKVRSFEQSNVIRDYFRQMWPLASRYVLKSYGTYCPFSANGAYYVQIGDNGELYLFETKNWSSIVSLIGVDEKEWFVATQEGFFDGSPTAWKAMYWRFNNNSFNHAPLEAFFNEYYHPGLLPDVLAGKRPQPPDGKDMSRIDRRQPKVTISQIADAGPNDADHNRFATVAIDVEENANTMVATEKSTSGARDVRLFRNGSLVKAWRGDIFSFSESDGCEELLSLAPAGPRRVRCSVRVPIVAGANEFTAYAFNEANVKSADATLSIKGDAKLHREPTLHVVSVGINEYDYQPLDLRFAVADAEAFASTLIGHQANLKQFANVRAVRLFDKSATKESVLLALNELARQAQPEDSVIVYFAGHGTAHNNHFYLIPHNIGYAEDRPDVENDGLEELLRRSISDRELETAFERIDAARILLVVDACNSGQALEADEKRRGPMNSKGLAQLAYEKGMYVLTAAQSFQAAQEVSKLGHGLLTFALVEEGLNRPAADYDRDGSVELREWLDYATCRVPQMQVHELQLAKARGARLSFDDSTIAADADRSSQRPRVFYRRDVDAAPLTIAHVPSEEEGEKTLSNNDDEPATPIHLAADDVDIRKRGMLGVFRKGPAEDLKADIVLESNSAYHTPNSTQAVVGMYGKAVAGNRLLGKLPRFEQRGVVQQLDHIRRIETVHRQGHGSGKDFLSLFGSRQAWQVVDIGAGVSGGRAQEVSFEIVGVRLEQSDVINALNADADALNYFDYLRKKNEPPCVVLENVLLTSYNAAQTTNVGVGVTAETVVTTDSAKAQLQNERSTSTQYVSPVVRCYQMYEVKIHQNRVVELVAVTP